MVHENVDTKANQEVAPAKHAGRIRAFNTQTRTDNARWVSSGSLSVNMLV